MAKRKRKNDEYYFDVFLDCGAETGDAFEVVMEVHDYFMALERGQSLQISAESLYVPCRVTMGIYDPDMQPLDVQIVAPSGTVRLKDATVSGEYTLRLRCETEIAGAYRIAVACNTIESGWQKIKHRVISLFSAKS